MYCLDYTDRRARMCRRTLLHTTVLMEARSWPEVASARMDAPTFWSLTAVSLLGSANMEDISSPCDVICMLLGWFQEYLGRKEIACLHWPARSR